MSVNFSPFIGGSYGYGVSQGYDSGWAGNFNGCCQRTLGARRSGLTGALLGGLVGTIAGCGNPLTGLLGAGIGGLLGSVFGGRHHNHHHQQNHCGAGSYPPPCGGGFGGMQYGGYGCPPNYGNPYGGGFPGGGYGGGFPGGYGGGFPGGNYGGGFPGGYGGGGFPGGSYGNCFPGYQQQFPSGCSPWGGGYQQQWGGGNCFPQQGGNFNFGNQCPQSCCCPGQQPQQGGQLDQAGKGKPIEYKTSGGYSVKIDKHTITITDPNGKNTQQTWGDPHENVNGKHVSDWAGKQRSIVLGDGTKITMSANDPKGVVNSTSIYDGRMNVQVENGSNTVTHFSMNPRDTAYREQSQYDGQTAIFTTNPRNGVARFADIYNQDANFNVTQQYKQIASTGGYANPSTVNKA